jgi:phospholipid/cholesterol/gamma-HCH transport system substrate-binding protein
MGVGVFVLATLILFTVGLFMIGDRQMAFARKFVVYAEFGKITGLQPGAIVRVSGAKAGAVKDIVPPDGPAGKFRVRLEIVEDLHPLVRSDSVASIETEGLVGGSYLAVTTGTEQAPPAPEGSTISGREPFAVADLLSQLGQTIERVNETITVVQDNIQVTIEALGETFGNVNALVVDLGDDLKTMASSGARISGDIAELTDSIRDGKGTIGKLVNDEELYRRATGMATQAEHIAADVRQVVQQARQALDQIQGEDGAVQGVTSGLKQTLDESRHAMASLAENMTALKHNFFFRGFFKDRGYFDLSDISPAEYRRGVLAGEDRGVIRIWLKASVVFESMPGSAGERLTDAGKRRLQSAMAPYLEHLSEGILVVEGYAREGSSDEQYLRSRERAAAARDYLIGTFSLAPQATGLMPLGSQASGSPAGDDWDGLALAFLAKRETLAAAR